MRALAKVIQVMPARLRRRVEALSAATVPASWGSTSQAAVDPAILTTAAMACRDAERLRFSYTAAGGEQTDRHVEPHRLVLLGRRWYLVGYDLTRQDWRSFRLDRLAGPRGTGARFRPRELPATDAAAFVQAGIGRATAVYEVEALVDAPAEIVREGHGRYATVEAVSETRSRIRMTIDQLEWPMMLLGSLGVEFQVISPPELLDQVRDWGRRFGQAGRTTREG